MKLVNPFTQPGRWYKANLHTHTTTSDGRQTPPDRCETYRRAGYHVLALTDHRKTNDVTGLSRKGFLVVSGMEFHPDCPGSPDIHHLVAINVPHPFEFPKAIVHKANAAIAAVRAAGAEVFLAHPNWCGHRYDQYAYLEGLIGVEVFNATCDQVGRAYGEVDWCHCLDEGRVLGGLAVDDTHRDIDLFRGWTWLKLEELTAPAVVQALRTGAYYSSTGPAIQDFRVEGGVAKVAGSPAERIYVVCNKYFGGRRLAAPGKTVRKFECPLHKDAMYARAVVVDAAGRRAWTNPVVLR